MSEFLDHLLQRAAKLQKTIALAEGTDPRVAKAAEIFTREKIGKIVLIGNEAEIRAKYPDYKFAGVTFRDPAPRTTSTSRSTPRSSTSCAKRRA